MQASLQAHFSDLPAIDMKEILQQMMFEDKSYEAHKDHKKLYDALEKSRRSQIWKKLTRRKERDMTYQELLLGLHLLHQVHLFDDEDSENDHLPKADSRKDWWKPLPEEKRPVTPEPSWTIPSSTISDVENNWATALVSAYETHAENSLLAKTRDMTNFLNWYCRRVNKTALTPTDLKGQDYEVLKAFYPDVIHLQFQMEECHKMLTYHVD
uniref:Uncharacterized protein n=1 Tax=Tanacetum cinerariifolium TaxID=118510 RepID=A0A6L2M2U4_TANCI|nr:hypothetical protein [Tanacetum cinerariifolium]